MESKFFNKYIFFFLVFFGLLYFVSLDSYAGTNSYTVPKGESIDFIYWGSKLSNSTTYNSYTYPVTTVTMSASVSATYSSNFVSYSSEAHFVTSEGDFVVAFAHKNSTSNSNTVKLMGYPISYYWVCKATATSYTSGTGNITFGYNDSTSMNISVSDSSGLTNYLTMLDSEVDSVQSDTTNIYSDTQQIISLLENLGDDSFSYVKSYTLKHNSNVPYPIRSSVLDYTYQLTSNNTVTATYTGSFDYCTIYNYITLCNGNMVLISPPYNFFPTSSSGSFSLPLNISSSYAYLESSPLRLYSFIIIHGGDGTEQVDPKLTSAITVTPYKKNIENNWDTIADSPNIDNLNNTVSGNNYIVSNIDTFEADSFNSLSQNLDNSGLLNVDYSEILPFMSFATSTIMQFYNVLPSSFRVYISFIMGVGIILMLLSVGTFFVKKSGQQINTRDREVKRDMKYSERSAKRGK